MKKSTQRIIVLVLAAAMLLSVLLPALSMLSGATSATKKNIDSLKSQISANSAQIDDLEAKLKKAQGERAEAKEQKDLLEQKIGVINEQISSTEAVIAEYEALIAEKQAEIRDLQEQEAAQYKLFCRQTREMEEHGSVSYLSILFSASSFTELLDNAMLVGEIMKYHNGVIDALTATREELKVAQAELEGQKAEQEEVVAQQEANRAQLKEEQAKVEKLIEQIKAQEADYQEDLDKFEEASRQLDEQLAAAEAKYKEELAEIERKRKEEEARRKAEEARRKAAAAAAAASGSSSSSGSSDVVATSGEWYWPLPGRYYISSLFANRRNPVTGRYGHHTGNDIPAPRGTAIHSAGAGVVTSVKLNDSVYGNCVLVSHGGGYSTFYAHMKSAPPVSEGDTVSKGQVIGYVGSTGWSTGNHLHFELRINGTRKDALSLYPNINFSY